MPSIKPKPFEQDKNGRYLTDGLTQSQFIRVFGEVSRQQRDNRTKAKRTLTPQKLKRRSIEDLVKLGRKEDGTSFTVDDLKRFEKMRRQFRKRRSGETGISYAELIANAREVDIKRANGTSNDGLAISHAQSIKLDRSNVGIFRVKASIKSVHQEHRVKLRFEDWEQELEEATVSNKGYQAAVKRAMKGRFSIECSCGRHQHWYRYMATIGGYQLGQPRELAFPKIRNPNLKGTACKHVLKVVQMLQSSNWQYRLAAQMEKQAKKVGFNDSGVGATKTWNEKDQKEMSRNRSLKITEAQVAQAKEEFARYQSRKASFSKQLKGVTGKEAKALRAELKRSKKSIKSLTQKVNAMKRERNNNIKQAIAKQAKVAIDLAMKLGVDRNKAVSAYAKQSGLSEAAINKAIDNAN